MQYEIPVDIGNVTKASIITAEATHVHVLVETSTELSRLETHCIKSPLDRHLHFFSY